MHSQTALTRNFSLLCPLNCPHSDNAHQTAFGLGCGFQGREREITRVFPPLRQRGFSVWINQLAPWVSTHPPPQKLLSILCPHDPVSKPTSCEPETCSWEIHPGKTCRARWPLGRQPGSLPLTLHALLWRSATWASRSLTHRFLSRGRTRTTASAWHSSTLLCSLLPFYAPHFRKGAEQMSIDASKLQNTGIP